MQANQLAVRLHAGQGNFHIHGLAVQQLLRALRSSHVKHRGGFVVVQILAFADFSLHLRQRVLAEQLQEGFGALSLIHGRVDQVGVGVGGVEQASLGQLARLLRKAQVCAELLIGCQGIRHSRHLDPGVLGGLHVDGLAIRAGGGLIHNLQLGAGGAAGSGSCRAGARLLHTAGLPNRRRRHRERGSQRHRGHRGNNLFFHCCSLQFSLYLCFFCP